MADEPATPQKVTPTVNWASLTQTIFLGVLAALQGVQLTAPRPADGIPPAPPAPTITAATLHDDLVRIEKKLDDHAAKPNPEIADLYTEFRVELARIEKKIDDQAKKK